jgi:hypothetical protein
MRPQATVAERPGGGLQHRRNQSSRISILAAVSAWMRVSTQGSYGVLETASSAALSIGGSAFPRLSARLKMPLQAFADSEYLGGSGPVSKTSDNEDTSPALRDGSGPSPHSHVLSVQHSVGPPIPELAQR